MLFTLLRSRARERAKAAGLLSPAYEPNQCLQRSSGSVAHGMASQLVQEGFLARKGGFFNLGLLGNIAIGPNQPRRSLRLPLAQICG